MLSQLGFTILRRKGLTSSSSYTTERSSLDFLINKKSLLNKLDKEGDFMGCFVKGFDNLDIYKELLLLQLPKTDSGRSLIYICPECGDIGCGAYTCKITLDSSKYIWSNFAYENGYEEPYLMTNIESIFFDKIEYEKIIQKAFNFFRTI
ncbi:hypothetical protein LEP1GSC170_2750 [Leptospira interrogans serovar Bataviae str. HAI135]|nr:hypothetical protein LEP1GSC170_2750 [Leptospira interrogans serovar Bataviae str. HAI135]